MSLNFYVRLFVKNPCSDFGTNITVANLGCSEIKDKLSHLIARTNDGSLPFCGEIAIDERTDAFAVLNALKTFTYIEYQKLGNQIEELIYSDPENKWSSTYASYLDTGSYLDQLHNAVTNIKNATNNPNISCLIVWT